LPMTYAEPHVGEGHYLVLGVSVFPGILSEYPGLLFPSVCPEGSGQLQKSDSIVNRVYDAFSSASAISDGRRDLASIARHPHDLLLALWPTERAFGTSFRIFKVEAHQLFLPEQCASHPGHQRVQCCAGRGCSGGRSCRHGSTAWCDHTCLPAGFIGMHSGKLPGVEYGLGPKPMRTVSPAGPRICS